MLLDYKKIMVGETLTPSCIKTIIFIIAYNSVPLVPSPLNPWTGNLVLGARGSG